jgi:HEAT repeat protein
MPYDFGVWTTVGDVVARDLCDLPKNDVHKFMASVLAKAPTATGATGLVECLAKKDRSLLIPHARKRLAARGTDLPFVIEALGTAADTDSGIRILGYAEHLDRDVRRAVANAIGDLHAPAGLAAIRKMIDDADRSVRVAACRAYVRIPGFDPDVARRALKSDDFLQRDSTAEGLTLTGTPEALSLLRDYAPSDHGTRIGPRLMESPAGRAVLAQNIYFHSYHWAARIHDDPAHADEILFHHDNGVRMAALEELTKHPQPALAPQVRRLLNDQDQYVRDWAARALKALEGKR